VAFNLKKKFQEATAQVNMWDGGKTAATVRAGTRPAPATLPAPGAPKPQPNLLQRTGSMLNRDVVRPTASVLNRDIARPAGNAFNHVTAPFQDTNSFTRGATAVGLGGLRSAVGTAQAASGLYDLAGGQHGTNRFDKTLDRAGKTLDQTAREQPGNMAAYKVGQFGTDALQMAFGGGVVKAGAKALTEAPKVGQGLKLAGKGVQAIEKPGQLLADATKGGNIAQRTVGKAAANIISPKYQAVNAAFTTGQEGKNASHGQPVTRGSFAKDLAIGGLAFPAAGAVGSELAAPAIRAAAPVIAKGARNADKAVKNAQSRTGINDSISSQQRQLQREIQSHQKQIKSLPINKHVAVENIQRKIDAKQGQIKQLEASRPQRSAVGKVADRYLSMQPGGTVGGPNGLGKIRAAKQAAADNPHADLSPEQHDFIGTYADMLRDMDKGAKGGQLVADGEGGKKRISEHTSFYRDHYKQNGKAPTKAHYFDEARRQLESGKAMPEAVNDYRGISQPIQDNPLAMDASEIGAGFYDTPEPTIAPFNHDPNQAQFKGLQPNKQFPKSYDPAKLSDALDYPALFEQYPQLKDYTLKYHDIGDTPGTYEGIHYAKKKVISLDRDLTDSEKLPTLMHEIQHAIQGFEGRLDGQSSKEKLGYHGYKDNPIEVEARGIGEMYGKRPTRTADVPPTPPPARPEPAAAPAVPEDAAQRTELSGASGKDTPNTSKLNTERLNIDEDSKAFLDKETEEAIGRMSNDEVQAAAKSAGIDTRSHTPEQTRAIIAKQLNTRQSAVKLLADAKNETDPRIKADLLKRAAEAGRTSREQGTDIARQLQARKIIANELDSPEQRLFKLLDNAGVNPDVYAEKLAGIDLNDPKAVVGAYREMVPAKFGNWLDTVRYNSMLSSPLTQAVNIFGNVQNVTGVAPIEKTLRGAIDVAGGLFGRERQYSTKEGGAYIAGAAKSIGEASRNLVDAYKGTGRYANKDLEEYSIPLATKGAAGFAYKKLTIPMRALNGFDKFFRTLAENGEDAALNTRQKAGIAVKGNRDALKSAEADYRVFQTDIGTPGQGIVNDTFDEFAKLAMKGRNSKNPIVSTIAKFTIPFVKTVNNISKQGIVDYSPLGFVNLKGNTDKEIALARAIMGTAVFGTSAALIGAGQMTWAEPRDAEGRARFRAEGKQPYAVKVGGKWVNFSKLAPAVAFPMAMTAAIHDSLENKKIDQSTADSVLGAISKYGSFLADQSYAKQVGDTLGALGGDTESIANAVSNNVQQLVPFRAFTGWLARISDDSERKVDTSKGYIDQQVQALMQQYPGLRQRTATRDYKGAPIAANNQVFNNLSPVKVTTDRGVDPLDAEADRLKTAAADTSGLDKRQQKELEKITGPEVTKLQKELLSDPDYKTLPADKQKQRMDKVKSDVTAARKAEYMAKNNVGQYAADYKGKQTKLTPDQQKLLDGSSADYGLADTDINKGIAKSSQDTLKRYSRMNDDERKAATDKENDFEYKYLVAKYDNDNKGGKLSKAADIKARDAIDKALVGKDYSKEVRDLYGLSKGDLADFVASNPDGKKYSEQLLAYDQALQAAGIIDKAKFKGGSISKGKSGRGITDFSLYSGSSSNAGSQNKRLRQLLESAHLS
jgi:DNA-binding ferritin-like protein (Dps family)